MKRDNKYSGTEEQFREDFPDTNCNDLIKMELSVNGKRHTVLDKTINTQKEWYQFQTELMSRIERLRLTDINRFGK